MAAKILTAHHPEYGSLWASVDAATQCTKPRVAERRFSAFLAPYRSEEDAAAALIGAGGTLDVISSNGRRGG